MILLLITLSILLILFVLLALILWMPLCLQISSKRQYVALSIPPLAGGHLSWEGGEFSLGYRLLFWRRAWNMPVLLTKISKKEAESTSLEEKESSSKRKRKAGKKRWGKFLLRKLRKNAWDILRSFKIRYWNVNLDTDDFILNAYLYPVSVAWCIWGRHPIRINFDGKQEIELDLVQRPIRVLYAILK
ncbi:MAG: hypothetical protein AAFW00_03215 [Bacteroidota bacterium]